MRICFTLSAVVTVAALQAAEPPARITRRVESIRPDARGRLVRSVTVISRPVSERVITPKIIATAPDAPSVPEPVGIDEVVEQIAAQQSLPPQLLHSVIKVESNYNPLAVSNKGAQGLMQLIPATARRFGVENAFNPVENIQGGAKYLRYLLDLYQGDYPLALAAYNAGEGAVAKYGGVPPYKETRSYVQSVRKQLEKTSAKPVVKPEPKAAEAVPVSRIVQIVEADGSVRYVSR